MPPSTDELDATGLRDAQWFATRLRERAQERIVHSFRAQLEGGPEPTDEDLAIFAKLAAEEHRLGQRRAEATVMSAAAPRHAASRPAAPQPPPPRRASPKAVPMQHWLAAIRARWQRAPDAPSAIQQAPRARGPVGGSIGLEPWRNVMGSAAVVCLMFGGFALWYPLVAMSPAPVTAAARQSAPTVPVAVASAPTDVTPVQLAPLGSSVDVALTPIDDTRAPTTVSTLPAPVAKHAAQQAPRSRSDAPAAVPPAHAVVARQRHVDPLASCRPLNFFARAICMNDTCAQRQFARHSACGTVLAQRRVDEARRNPTLLN